MKKVSHIIVGLLTIVFIALAMLSIIYLVQQKAESSSKQINNDNNNIPSESPYAVTEIPTSKPTKTKIPKKIKKVQPIWDEETGEYKPFDDYLSYIESTKTSWNDKVRPDASIYLEEELYNFEDIVFNLDTGRSPRNEFYLRNGKMEKVLRGLPTTAIGVNKDKTYIYLMYDTETGTRLFLFYSKEKHNYRFMDGFPVKMSTKRSYSDYKHLKSGDLYEEVLKLEPAVSPQFEELWNQASLKDIDNATKKGMAPTTIHILTDGVLKIDYKRNAENKYEITNLIYAEDYVLDGLDGKTCYQIHPDDFVEE